MGGAPRAAGGGTAGMGGLQAAFPGPGAAGGPAGVMSGGTGMGGVMGGTPRAAAPPVSQVKARQDEAAARAKASDPFAFATEAFG